MPSKSTLKETSSDNRISASQIAIETFVRRNRFQWVYILLFNVGGQILTPRFHPYWPWKLFTVVDLLLCCIRLPLDLKLRRPAGITTSNVRLLGIFAVVHPLTMGFAVSSAYFEFGFDQINLVATVLLVGYTFGALILMRPNLRVLQSVSVAYTLLPALTALCVGGYAGYAIGAHLLAVLLFCFQQGRLSNAEFWALLHANRDLHIARRRAEASVHREAELIAQHTRQSVIGGERTRIAAEWHDTLLAGFSAIAWQLDVAEGHLPIEPQKSAQAMKVARTMLSHYRTESRLVIADMHGNVEDPENLQVAVTQALAPVSQGRSVKIAVTTIGEQVPIASDKTHQLIRICQEAVSNALQHAAPQFVQVTIRHEEAETAIEILDDGCGFDSQTNVSGHYGLEIMKDRAHRLGGSLEVHSQLGVGTTVTVRLKRVRSTTNKRTRVLIVEDQYFSRLALRSVLDSRPDWIIVGEATTGAAGIELFRQHKPEITIVDLRLPDTNGFDVIRAVRLIDPDASIVVVSNVEGAEQMRRATDAGAAAFLTKNASSSELLETIATVATRKTDAVDSSGRRKDDELEPAHELTARECDVLEQLVLGLSNRDIGSRLGVSEKTVGVLMSSILQKLGAADRDQAGEVALQRGLVDLPSSFIVN